MEVLFNFQSKEIDKLLELKSLITEPKGRKVMKNTAHLRNITKDLIDMFQVSAQPILSTYNVVFNTTKIGQFFSTN